MEYITLELSQINGTVDVKIVRKNIKNVHLKVFRSLEVVLSVPMQVPQEWIENFLSKRIKWIDEQITKYKLSGGTNTLDSIKNGTSVQMLGKDMRIVFQKDSKNYIEVDEKRITLFLKDVTDEEFAQKMFLRWWKKTAEGVFQNELDALYEKIFKKYQVAKPDIYVRKMKTLWGSCTPSKSKVTFNNYLFKANIRCIQYVVLHELTHLLYPNHSKQFYDFLTVHMPDWQERKKQLDTEVVQGL
jgi:predicted metal-dependent hydrolase